MNTKIAEGTLMREYILKMFAYLNPLEILDGEIDGESQIDIILESLPNFFNQFKFYCSINKIDFTLAELLNVLLALEIKDHPSINNVEKILFFKHFPKEKGKWKKKKVPSNSNKVLNPFRGIDKWKKVNGPKSKEKCSHYRVAGHWKRNCPNYLPQKKNSGINESLIIGVRFIMITSNF